MAVRERFAAVQKVFLLALLAAGSENVSAQVKSLNGDDSRRQSMTRELTRQQRDRGEQGIATENEFSTLDVEGERLEKKRSPQNKIGAVSAPNNDFWFYAADVILFNDHDGDGYFFGIDLLFDADTFYSHADVYAVVYLSLEGGPWNELAATEHFSIAGATADDEYVIVTELVTGYPSGSYDLLVDLFDAYDDTFVASYGPEDTPALAFLSLEDAERDAPQGTAIIVREQGGGALGWPMLLLLMIFSLRFSSRRWP